MNMRMLKLVNDERKSLVIRSAKGCTGNAQDICVLGDYADGCTMQDMCYLDSKPCAGSVDVCGIDY